MLAITPLKTSQTTSPKRAYSAATGAQQFGSALPWDVALSRYHLANRFVLNFFGVAVWDIGFSRNKYERLEHVLSLANVWAFGIGLPILIQLAWCKKLTQQLQNQFRLSKTAKPFEIPFEYLEHHQFKKITAGKNILLKPFGITGANKLNPAFQRAVLKGKIAFLLFDMLALALRGILFYYGRNWLTEKLSGKKGFSGEFKIASDAYLKQQSQGYETNKKFRQKLSILLSIAGSAAFPFILYGLLKSKQSASTKSVIGKLKSLVPHFNYSNVVYLSKYALMWQVFWNWNLSGFMAARDKHERREHIVKSVITDFFFFIGDDYISGGLAKWLQTKYKKQLKNIKLVESKRGLFGNIQAIELSKLYNIASTLKDNQQKKILLKLGRTIFGAGLLGTSLCLGIFMTLANNWYTKQKVLQEQASQ